MLISLTKKIEKCGTLEFPLAGGEPFDAVIMDLTIPGGMGGREAVKELLRIDPQVKAIVSSG
jgi:DNA-binding NarL/FixJ family response regulator